MPPSLVKTLESALEWRVKKVGLWVWVVSNMAEGYDNVVEQVCTKCLMGLNEGILHLLRQEKDVTSAWALGRWYEVSG